MATIIKGLLAQDLPWGLVFCGMAIAIVVQMCGVRALSFAVGLYLPLATTLPIFIGGMLRWWVDRKKAAEEGHDSELSPGMLASAGLVAGGALTGVLIAALQVIPVTRGDAKVSLADYLLDMVGVHGLESAGMIGNFVALVAFGFLCAWLLRVAKAKTA
jgi:uncharacterized oligopeptide transporter (OPT) family protein